MNTAMQETLESLPGLFHDLMGQPLLDIVKGCLPTDDALYVFYQQDEPVLVGSIPHVNELQLLSPSVRLQLKVHIRNYAGNAPVPTGPFRRRPLGGFDLERQTPLKARWLPIASERQRMFLEVYTAQKLGLNLSHPELKRAIGEPTSRPQLDS